MHSFYRVLYDPEYNNFDSYYLPWFDSGYISNGPYGEPFQYTQEGLYNESNSVYDETGDGFPSGSWYSGHRLADEVYDNTVEGGSNWINEYTSYFASCSFDDENMVGAHSINPCPINHPDFVDGIKDSYSITGNPIQPPEEDSENEDSRDYVGLWENIFCFSPCSNR